MLKKSDMTIGKEVTASSLDNRPPEPPSRTAFIPLSIMAVVRGHWPQKKGFDGNQLYRLAEIGGLPQYCLTKKASILTLR